LTISIENVAGSRFANPLPAYGIPVVCATPLKYSDRRRVEPDRSGVIYLEMGTFYAKCKIENPAERTRAAVLERLLVDTGSEFTWAPGKMLEKIGIKPEKKDVGFVLANGEKITRSVGFAIIRLDKFFTIDEIVFAEPGDLTLLGARTLEGLNLAVEPSRRRLVAAGPLPAAPVVKARK